MRIGVSSLLVVWFAVLALLGGDGSRARASSASTPVDVEIAIDGTGSMGDAVARAQSQATQLTAQAAGLLPDIRFAVVVFRDPEASLGEYALLQPFTSDSARVKAAIDRIKTTAFGGPDPESYNLVFHRSYSDDQMGWRPSATPSHTAQVPRAFQAAVTGPRIPTASRRRKNLHECVPPSGR
jgi:hypothetical protein